MTLHLTIKYFASLREKTKKNEEVLLVDVASPKELYSMLVKKYDFTLTEDSLRVGVNGMYVPFNHPLSDHDEIVFIPPVAGG